MFCTTPDVVVMKIHDRVIELRTGLRMMMFSAGVLAVLLACAAANATCAVDDSGGADFTSIQTAVVAAIDGDSIEVWGGSYV